MSDLTTLRADFASLCAALPAASNSTASPLSNPDREASLGAAISSAVALFTTSDEGDRRGYAVSYTHLTLPTKA